MDHFSYHSDQTHAMFRNGKGQTRRNIVSVKDGKGKKIVEFYDVDGKQVKHSEKSLTQKELDHIQQNRFIPGLFKNCTEPSSITRKRRMRPKRGTKHRRNK